MSQPYRMPKVSLGDVVLWNHNRTSPEPCPAVVTALGDRAIGVSLVVSGSPRVVPKDGVRHADDPDNATIVSTDSGVWTETDGMKRLAAAEAAHANAESIRKGK